MGIGGVAMIDPTGSQMSNDSDPFGVPPTFIESFLFTVLCALFLVCGILLIFNGKKKSNIQ